MVTVESHETTQQIYNSDDIRQGYGVKWVRNGRRGGVNYYM